MRPYFKHILIIIFVMLASTAYAQNQKIAYFDSEFILSKIPEYQGIEQQLRLLGDSWKTELSDKDKEIKELQQDLKPKKSCIR